MNWFNGFKHVCNAMKGHGANVLRGYELQKLKIINDTEEKDTNKNANSGDRKISSNDKVRRKMEELEKNMRRAVRGSDTNLHVWDMFQKQNPTPKPSVKSMPHTDSHLIDDILNFRTREPTPVLVKPLVKSIPHTDSHLIDDILNFRTREPTPVLVKSPANREIDCSRVLSEFIKIYGNITLDVAKQWYNTIQCDRDEALELFQTSVCAVCLYLFQDLRILELWEVTKNIVQTYEGVRVSKPGKKTTDEYEKNRYFSKIIEVVNKKCFEAGNTYFRNLAPMSGVKVY